MIPFEHQREQLERGERLAARLEPIDNLLVWVLVCPFKVNPETGLSTLNAQGEPWRFRVRHFGIPKDFDYYNYDLHPEYITNFRNEIVGSIEQVEQLVSQIVDDVDKLVYPRDCKCPL
jgi:hypothetical protein